MLEMTITDELCSFGAAWSNGRKATVQKYTAVTSVLYVEFQASTDPFQRFFFSHTASDVSGNPLGPDMPAAPMTGESYFSLASTWLTRSFSDFLDVTSHGPMGMIEPDDSWGLG
jgi:hypothetical protein